MGLLSGLGDLGLGKLEGIDIYSKEEPKQGGKSQAAKDEPAVKEISENDFLLDKTITCPVCGNVFKTRALKTNKARIIGQDQDLRPRYEYIDPIKYDVIVCSKCGNTSMTKYFGPMSDTQSKLIKANLAGRVHGVPYKETYDYDDALKRYQLALACAVIKKAKDSEKAFTCLKMAWVIRGKAEGLDLDDPTYDEQMEQLRKDELEAIRGAYEGFMSARSKEIFPIAGMDEPSLEYLLAVLASKCGEYEMAGKMVSAVLGSRTANDRIKDKARGLKEQIQYELKMRNAK